MTRQDFQFEIGSRVALKDDCEQFYPYAWSGSEGWVRDRKYDDDDFAMVMIEWDKEHWRYNDERDMWTFESHFRLIEEPKPEPKPEEPKQEVTEISVDEEVPCPHCGGHHTREENEYMERLADAFSVAQEGEGFMIIAIEATESDDPDAILLRPMVFARSLSDESTALLEWQVTELAKLVNSDRVTEIRRLLDGREET